jgi:hypothetical protein
MSCRLDPASSLILYSGFRGNDNLQIFNYQVNNKKNHLRFSMQSGDRLNRWGIPEWLEKEVKERDKSCIYCGIQMIERMPPRGPRKNVATWKHIINDASVVTRENIARCCVPCNSSKGTKNLSDWIQSSYCKKRGIDKENVAEVVKKALRAEWQANA